MSYSRLHRIYYQGMRVGRAVSPEIKCEGCLLYFATHRTRKLSVQVFGYPETYTLCLDCADRVESADIPTEREDS